MKTSNKQQLPDLDIKKLKIDATDKAANKFMMLVEGTYGIGVKKSIEKYGYTEPRYYQLKKKFMEEGYQGLIDGKRGPRTRHKRTEAVDKLIIRMRFVDPQCSAAVITQKLNQKGISISQRTVERTITEYGLQKKTLQVKSRKTGSGHSS